MRLKLKYFKYKAFKALLYVDSSKEKTPLTNKIKINFWQQDMIIHNQWKKKKILWMSAKDILKEGVEVQKNILRF